MPKQDVMEALGAIKRRKGKLLATDVVEAARDEDSPLHDHFDWDDSSAAHRYRLWQARQLIVSVQIVDEAVGRPVQLYYSLKGDQLQQGGGYRDVRDIVSDEALRAELVQTALWQLTAFKDRYKRIERDLADVFKAIDELQERVNRRKRKSA